MFRNPWQKPKLVTPTSSSPHFPTEHSPKDDRPSRSGSIISLSFKRRGSKLEETAVRDLKAISHPQISNELGTRLKLSYKLHSPTASSPPSLFSQESTALSPPPTTISTPSSHETRPRRNALTPLLTLDVQLATKAALASLAPPTTPPPTALDGKAAPPPRRLMKRAFEVFTAKQKIAPSVNVAEMPLSPASTCGWPTPRMPHGSPGFLHWAHPGWRVCD